MKHDRLFHILRFLRFSNNKKENADKKDDNYECLLNMRIHLTSSMIHMPNITAQLDI